MSKLLRVSTTAQRLQLAMDIKKMKQADLAKATDLARGTISNYLKSKYEPKSTAINTLAKALNVSEMWLWGYDVPMEREQKNISPDELALSEGEKLLLELFRKIPEEHQPQALEMLRVALKMQKKL